MKLDLSLRVFAACLAVATICAANVRAVFANKEGAKLMHDDKVVPTIVLVHGALTDASVWKDVILKLQLEGYQVLAPAMPLRGLHSDIAYLDSILETVQGPIVLVGHSYGGAVISGIKNTSQVKALVYVAAFQPDAGETAGELNGRFPGSKLGADTTIALSYPGGKDVYLKPAAFREVYAGDVPVDTAAAMAVAQRPIDGNALSEPLQSPATWHGIRSWALVATKDNSIPTAALRFMAARAHSKTVEVESSHAVPVAHPSAVVGLVIEAARSIHQRPFLDVAQ
jgi:pimeloyl-ACP methyl ester carboxylesterase